MEDISGSIQKLFIWVIPVLFAVTVHETAHGWVASKLGDRTALLMGRLTLNPFKHIDLLGTVIVPLLCVFLGGFVFGWAKPVPIDWRNLKNPRRDMALVAAAGPGANLLMALFWAMIAKIFLELTQNGFPNGKIMVAMGLAGISINLMLLLLNLIPIPPLDGSRVVSSFLDKKLAIMYDSLEPYGFMILMSMVFLGILNMILQGPYMAFLQGIYQLFSLH